MNKNQTAFEELIQYYGLKLAHKALWSPEWIRQVAAAALTHCDPRPVLIPCPLCAGRGGWRQGGPITGMTWRDCPICDPRREELSQDYNDIADVRFFVAAEEACPLCDGCGYIENAMWKASEEQLGRTPTAEAVIQWWSKHGIYEDEIPPEEDICDQCNGTGRRRREVTLQGALENLR